MGFMPVLMIARQHPRAGRRTCGAADARGRLAWGSCPKQEHARAATGIYRLNSECYYQLSCHQSGCGPSCGDRGAPFTLIPSYSSVTPHAAFRLSKGRGRYGLSTRW